MEGKKEVTKAPQFNHTQPAKRRTIIFRDIIVKKSERSVAHAVNIGYKWETPASRCQPGEYLVLWEDGYITQHCKNVLHLVAGFKRLSIRRFLRTTLEVAE
jgi:hypothetical protein